MMTGRRKSFFLRRELWLAAWLAAVPLAAWAEDAATEADVEEPAAAVIDAAEAPPEEEAPPPAAADATPAPLLDAPPVTLPSTEAGPEEEVLPSAAAAPAEPETPIPPDQIQEQVDRSRIRIGVSAASDNAVLRLPFTGRTAMAVFVRARHLWVAWGGSLPPDLSDFDDLPRTVVGKAEAVAAEGASVIRMPIDDGVHVSVAREAGSFDWAILVTPRQRGLEKALPVSVNTDPPAPPHVLVPALEAADPVTVSDPQVGDNIIIMPFYSVGEGIGVRRDFVEFSLPQTAQGLAVIKKTGDVSVLPLRNGLRISLSKGSTTLSPDLPETAASRVESASQQAVTLFPYEYWKPDSDKKEEQMRALFHRIVESENQQQSNDARLRLAQIHLSQGMAAEALGYLDGVNRTNPAFYRSNKLAALRGAANFLMYRFTDAARDFAAAELNNNQEMDYWRGMLADLLGNPDQHYDYLALNADYISKYPPMFRQRLAIVAADRAIGSKDYNAALKIVDTLAQDGLVDAVQNYVTFLMAKISADTGQDQEAKETWDKLAADYRHPFVQARAEFSRILWEIEKENLPRDEVIERLERLRLAWHGDSLELNILTMLGDLYADRKDYVNAMRVWHGGVIAFPNTVAAIDMARKMQEAFITMFNEGLAESLPPLEALSLYYEYRSYTPTGNTGNAIINKLAERLVSVDLLNQAAALLDNQMRNQMEKERRSEIGARLAQVYLLNHQPQRALAALQNSVYGDNPLMLRLLRNRLTAQAMVALDQPDKALATLGSDNSVEAERIRISVYWQQKDWPKLTGSIENILKTRKDITAPITLEESEYLLRLALAYVFQNNRLQLKYLHDYFGPLMEDNPNQQVFKFIAGGDIQLTTTNFDDVIKRITDTRTFIENYQARIRTSDMGGPETATP